jgi:hypothetical protein
MWNIVASIVLIEKFEWLWAVATTDLSRSVQGVNSRTPAVVSQTPLGQAIEGRGTECFGAQGTPSPFPWICPSYPSLTLTFDMLVI